MTIDLRSDTLSRPTAAMRQAMANAEVGDDDRDGDPTTRRLESRLAELLGTERAMFFPSGVMANQAAIWLHTRPGTEVLIDADAHIIHWEMAGAAGLAGVQLRTVTASANGVMRAEDLRRTLRPASKFSPRASLVCVENTHNGAGGRVTPLEEMRAIADVARAQQLPVHLDGARLWNASAASGTPLGHFTACADTVMVSLSKGLGAPIGAALAFGAAREEELWSIRKRLGGSLRQSGILAAAALHALDTQLPKLALDHDKARTFAEALAGAPGVTMAEPETNIVMLDLPHAGDSPALVQRALEAGVRLTAWTPVRVRATFYLDVSLDEARTAGAIVSRLLENA
ncbi:MAG: threonine aldolase [Gemmatimonadetes bacterium]|nr:threonine aldolase [Gemmatimonadota bacterium]